MAGAVVGITAAATRAAASFWFPEFGIRELIETRWLWLSDGLVAGVCLGAVAWLLCSAQRRRSRVIRVLTTLNCAAWLTFLLLTERAPQSYFELIARQRAVGGMGTSDLPTIVAARFFGGWRWIPLPERWLGVMAGPAVELSRRQVVPVRHIASEPTPPESYVIAGLALLVSTGFWIIAGRAISAVAGRLSHRKTAVT